MLLSLVASSPETAMGSSQIQTLKSVKSTELLLLFILGNGWMAGKACQACVSILLPEGSHLML